MSSRLNILPWLARLWLLSLVCLAVAPLCWPGSWPMPLANPEAASLPPSRQHWFGTDPFGRDMVAEILAGTQQLVSVSLPAAVLSSVLGIALGAAAGYWRNDGLSVRSIIWPVIILGLGGIIVSRPAAAPWWLLGIAAGAGLVSWLPFLPRYTTTVPLDGLVRAASTLLGSVPRLLLVLVLTATQPPSRVWLVGLLVLTCWPATARLVRAQITQLRTQPYIEAGRAAGLSDARLLIYHLLPNIWPALRAVLPLNLSLCLALQTTLAFLGVGLSPDQSDWGHTLANARLDPTAWWIIIATVLPLVFTVGALHILTQHTTSAQLLMASNGKD